MAKLETEWIYRVAIFVPADERELANAVHTLYWPEGDPEAFTFSVPLSSDGMLPATHYGTYTAATEMLWAMWKGIMSFICPGAVYYRTHYNEGILLETNGPTAQAKIGTPFYWAMALEDSQLQRIQEVSI